MNHQKIVKAFINVHKNCIDMYKTIRNEITLLERQDVSLASFIIIRIPGWIYFLLSCFIRIPKMQFERLQTHYQILSNQILFIFFISWQGSLYHKVIGIFFMICHIFYMELSQKPVNHIRTLIYLNTCMDQPKVLHVRMNFNFWIFFLHLNQLNTHFIHIRSYHICITLITMFYDGRLLV